MISSELYIVIFAVYAMFFGVTRKWILNSRKDFRAKKRLFAGLLVFSGVFLGTLVWSMAGFRFSWAVFFVLLVPVVLITGINLMTTGFCESCAAPFINAKFWQRAKLCPVCRRRGEIYEQTGDSIK
ncbi:MAG: hypothetical protein JSS81_19095 [Acidobacteria bacterium]|nr:hypothetical protein [Acidobacteriota bacterium]